MQTGLTKRQKRISIYFTEADEFVEICTYNTGFNFLQVLLKSSELYVIIHYMLLH